MAKENIRPNSRGKMTVMMFQLEGDDHTLQQGLDTIREAINKMVPTRLVQSIAPPPAKHGNGGTKSPQQVLPLDDQPMMEEDEEELEENGVARVSRARSPEKAPEVLKGIDWESGDAPFKKFCEEKNPQGNPDRYAVIAVWFKRNRDIAIIDRRHIYTCYGMMNWKKPGRLGDVFVNLQRRKGWFEAHQGDTWAVTLLGENRVDELPESTGG